MGAGASIESLNSLSTGDICAALESLDLSQCIEYVKTNNIDGKELKWIKTESDLMDYLADLGIVDEPHRYKITVELMKLNTSLKANETSSDRETVGQQQSLHSCHLTAEEAAAVLSVGKHVRLEERCAVDGLPGEGYTPLMAAAHFGNMNVLPLLLDFGADINATTVEENYSSLMLAARSGQEEAVEMLLALEPDINVQNLDGWTALMFACDKGYMSIVSVLVAKSADTSLRNKEGNSAVELLHSEDERDVFNRALRTPDNTIASSSKTNEC